MKQAISLSRALIVGVVALSGSSFAIALDQPATFDPNAELPTSHVVSTWEYGIMAINAELSGAETSSGFIPRERLRGDTIQELSDTELVTWAYENNLITSSKLSNFKADDSLSREDAAQWFVELTKHYYPTRPMTMKLCPFPDMNALSKTLQNSIQDACAYLYFNGYSDGNFWVGRAITQEEFKLVLKRVAKEDDQNLVDQVIRNKALLPSITRIDALRYINHFVQFTLSK